ncbi:hypothetical protein QBC47DRAFT_325344 [Echria macrotheca]|uniref:Leucine-rich repeat-containing protein 40 n=1 Tax=Echria macrotheca TaxID=438768 RepID=A0AAJ0BA12_9PEZI|nr:hypothetical protein QBC47DRAFT_325344 [Echria macrotheca]
MDDQRQNKLTGIPRLSKLPVTSSKLPVPRSNSVRTSPSRESLTGGPGSLRNPKLRATPSRDQLTSATTATTTSRTQTATAASRAASSPQRRAPLTQTPTSARTSRFSPSVTQQQRPGRTETQDSVSGVGFGSRPSSVTRNVPRRQPSQQWISAGALADEAIGSPIGDVQGFGTPVRSTSDTAPDTARSSSFKPRLSLAERTIETLSQLPSSPSVRGKTGAASFYDTGPRQKSPTRPSSRSSRPNSSHRSDGSSQGPSRPGSRPGSSSGVAEGISNVRSSISAYKNPLSPIDSTPSKTRHSLQSFQPLSKTGPRKSIRSSMQAFQQAPASNIPQSRTSSPDKDGAETPVSRFGAKTMAARPTKRPSINGLFRKPSMPTMNKSASEAPRKVSSASRGSSNTSGDGPSGTSVVSASTAITTDSTEPALGQTPRKSSAALREQIAKAKAAKKAVSRQVSNTVFESEESPLIPTDNTFDFGLSNDPFNLRRDDQSQAKVLQARLESARTSGRLNIAAMGLREIPSDVMNMYNLESVGKPGGAWAESVDLTRFVAADNELEMIADSVFPDVDPQDFADDEDSQGNIFAGLETLDLHGNMLIALPMGLRRLPLLTSLNLSHNRLANNCLEVISQISPLRDLKLGGNLLYGPLDPCFSALENLEILDLHGNNISSLPTNFGNLSRLRILNISENSFETLPFDIFATLPLTELIARKNQLRGTLIPDSVTALPALQNLDVSSNQLSRVCEDGQSVSMPALHQIHLSVNRLQSLPDISTWTSLLTLSADENNINAIPDGFTGLPQLRSVDLSSNDIRIVPAEIGRMENLAMLRLSGNPLREKKFSSINTDEMKAILFQRLEPPPEHLQHTDPPAPSDGAADLAQKQAAPDTITDHHEDMDDSRSDLDDFATPPTSAPVSPARSRSHTLSNQVWPVKPGGILDRSNTQSSTLHPVVCSKVAASHKIYEVQLHHNLLTALPDSLTFFAETLTALSLAHNQLVGESYMGGPSGNEGLDLPALKELNLASNHITGLGPLIAHLRAPKLQKLDVSCNRIAALPSGTQLRDAFPSLDVLLMANNHLVELDPESIKGLRVVDAGNNDIAHLNPRLGLLGGAGGLERLEVSGNRFRVPRWNVLERGTEATLRWLRGRVPVAEMAAWKGEDGDDDADLD